MRTISVKCTNTQYCGYVNTFPEEELVSGMSIKDSEGKIVEEHPPVTVDDNTFIKCESCGYPIRCIDAEIT